MLGSAEKEKVSLIRREIIFAENSNLYDHDTSPLETDGRTGGQLALAIPHSARLRAVQKLCKIIFVRTLSNFHQL